MLSSRPLGRTPIAVCISRLLDVPAQPTVKSQPYAIFALPNEQFQPMWNALMKRVSAENPFSAIIRPALDKVRDALDRQTVARALFGAVPAR